MIDNYIAEKFGVANASLLDRAFNAISPYITPIINPAPYRLKVAGTEVGTGTYAIVNGRRGILTNWHVAMSFLKKQNCSIVVPFTDSECKELFFEEIIEFGPINKDDPSSLPDLAFMVFRRPYSTEWEDILCSLNKQFFDFDKARNEYVNDPAVFVPTTGLWIIYGAVAEGAKTINNRKTIYYHKAGYYIVVPSPAKKFECNYEELGLIQLDSFYCQVDVKDRNTLPKSFEGMSGGALWHIMFDENDKIEKVRIVGIVTQQHMNEDQLIFQGPTTLYKTFLAFCESRTKASIPPHNHRP